jgi:glycosyltransferase involved in cell wall biosynthesis
VICDDTSSPPPDVDLSPGEGSPPIIIATLLRMEGTSGVATHVRQLCGRLNEMLSSDPGGEAPVAVVTPFSWGRLIGYPVFGFRLVLSRFSPAAGVAWHMYWHEVFLRQALRRRLAGAGPCVIYAQGPPEARAALRARRGPHQSVVMAVHFRVSQADEWCNSAEGRIKRNGPVFRWIRLAERATIPCVDRIIYVSNWARRALMSWLPEITAVPAAVIGNFIAPQASEPGPEVRDLVSTGTLDIMKNHRFLLEVVAAASRLGRPLTLDIFGDGPLRQELQDEARSLGVDGLVRFCGFRPDVRELLPSYRLYVHSSFNETSSFAIMEAMCAGLPSVAAPVGGVREVLEDGVEGRYWDLDDPAQAARTVIELLDDDSGYRAAAKAARDRFSRDYDADVVVPRLVSFLRGTPPPGAPWLVPADEEPLAGPFSLDPRLR